MLAVGSVTAATLGMIDAIGDVMKAAPQLTAALGIVTVAVGFFDKTPSPDDILRKAMKSVTLLSQEVNVMMDQMKDYVDLKDLQVEKNAMNNHYSELFELWMKCAQEYTRKDSDRCQRRVEMRISSARYHFQPLYKEFGQTTWNGKMMYNPNFRYRASAGTWQWMDENCGINKHAGAECLSHEDVKRLEIGIIPFRDYVFLHLLSLKTLEASYKNHAIDTDQVACAYYRKYLTAMKDKADMYIRYAKWAYEWDYIRQYEENDYFGVRGRAGGRPDSASRGGFLGTRKCSGSNKCSIQCTQMFADNTCVGNGGGASNAVFKACETYIGQVKQQLMTFWKYNVLDSVEIWKKYRDDAAAKLGKVTCSAAHLNDEEEAY